VLNWELVDDRVEQADRGVIKVLVALHAAPPSEYQLKASRRDKPDGVSVPTTYVGRSYRVNA